MAEPGYPVQGQRIDTGLFLAQVQRWQAKVRQGQPPPARQIFERMQEIGKARAAEPEQAAKRLPRL